MKTRTGQNFRRGFTFVELVLGMVITVMVLGALASLMTAVAQGWQQQGNTQSTYLANRIVNLRIQSILRPAKLTGLVREGSLASNSSDAAAIMIWTGDANADRKVQFAELAMLQHDRQHNSLILYQVSFPASLTPAQILAANKTYAYSDITSTTAPEDFKALNYVVGTTIANNVTGATFYVNWPVNAKSQLPSFEYQLAFTRGTATSQMYATATLRSPDVQTAQ